MKDKRVKRIILVLDVFTNGHEAATAFIKKQGWDEKDCSLVFCGSHSKLLDQLIECPSFAVIPIHNSIVGEVVEVTECLANLREKGYDLPELDRLDLQINHCLLVPQYITCVSDLEGVMSHAKALQQCCGYLDSVGLSPDCCHECDSTGLAAKTVSKLGPTKKIGAIAPFVAAREYGLRVLTEGIQDVPDNKTTFIFLENKAVVTPVTVGIIGINGAFGQLLKTFFTQLGCFVIGSDKNTAISNQAVVRGSEVVIFSVPIKDTSDIIRSVLPFVRPDQLLMDVTSVKQPAVEAMLKSEAQVVGLHPMFRPEGSFDGQTVVVCPARLTVLGWKTWVVNVLTATGSKIKWSTPAEHDSFMSIVQALSHLSNLATALVITETGVSVRESLTFTSPFYRLMLSLIGRLISQNPELYTSIIMENPETVAMLESRIAIEQRLLEMIRQKDVTAFSELFETACVHFGSEVLAETNEFFMRILGVSSTLYGKNSIILEFSKSQSHPGLLERVAGVFSRRKINLTGINSATFNQTIQFTISFEQSRKSNDVRLAIEEIESWPEKVKVLN